MPPSAIRSPRPRPRTMLASVIPLADGPTDEQIQMRAYEIYLARKGTPGTPDSDWRQAEQELRGRMELLGRS
jgi:hypothetical protein